MERGSFRFVVSLLVSALPSIGFVEAGVSAKPKAAWQVCDSWSTVSGIDPLRVIQYAGDPESVESRDRAIQLMNDLAPTVVGKDKAWLGLHPTADWERCPRSALEPSFLFWRDVSGDWTLVHGTSLEYLQSQLQRLPAEESETQSQAFILYSIAQLSALPYEQKLANQTKSMQILSEKGDPAQLLPKIRDELVNQCADTDERREVRNNALKTFAKMRSEEMVCTVEWLPMTKRAPVYPEKARRKDIEGFVEVEYTLSVDGKPIDPVIVQESPKGFGFGSAYIEALLKFTYRPRVVDGKPVEVKGIRNTMTFELD